MKKINRTIFNSLFWRFIVITLMFSLVFFAKDFENPWILIIVYTVGLALAIVPPISGINDIEYDEQKVRFTNPVSGKVKEISIKNIQKVKIEVVTGAPYILVFEFNDEPKENFGTIGCPIIELNEMVDFINAKLKEGKNKSKSE